ncbi:MAG: OmpA family protein [Pseudomonadota bacterium]
MRKLALGLAGLAALSAASTQAQERDASAVSVPPPAVSSIALIPPCNAGPYIVFFEWDQSELAPEAAQILDSAYAAYANCGTLDMRLIGHTDRSGSDAHNVKLGARRAASVREYLLSKGVPAKQISTGTRGEADNRTPTQDGIRQMENRRVEITYHSPSER